MDDSISIKRVFDANGGVVRTSTLREFGIYNQKLKKLIEEGIIEQIKRGYYQYIDDEFYSEIPLLVSLFPDGVLCMESALDYYGYTDRTPSAWHIAVDDKTARSIFRISYPIVKPHFIVSSKFGIGITEVEIEGTEIKVYDRERTICDCLLHRKKLDAEVFNNAIQSYIKDPERDPAKLAKYAPLLHVEKKVREVLEIWL